MVRLVLRVEAVAVVHAVKVRLLVLEALEILEVLVQAKVTQAVPDILILAVSMLVAEVAVLVRLVKLAVREVVDMEGAVELELIHTLLGQAQLQQAFRAITPEAVAVVLEAA